MDSGFDLNRLLKLRALTTALADYLERTAREHLASLSALLQPRALLGDLVRFEKAAVKGQDEAFRDLLKLYQPIASAPAINVQPDLKPPLDVHPSAIDIVRASYTYTPEGSLKPLTVVTPLKWVVVYKDRSPSRLRDLVANHKRSGGNDLQSCIVHYLVMHLLAERRPGVAPILEALRFPVSSVPNVEFAGLPFVYLASPISTMRAPDPIIVQSTLISGASTFEEVVDLSDANRLRDPLSEQILAIVREHGVEPH
jgi:hypothetical protein